MFNYNTMGSCVLVLTLATIFLAVLLIRQQRTGRLVAVWLMAGIAGILLGAAGYVTVIQLLGYQVVEAPNIVGYATDEPIGEEEDGGEGEGEAGGGRGQRGGGMGGGMGGFTPPPKRELTSLVRKVELLTGDISLQLTDEQAAQLTDILKRIEAQETMTDEEAAAANEEILAIFDEEQKAKEDAIGLPFSRRGRGGSGGGEEVDEDANPFADGQNATAIQSLLSRLGQAPADAEPVDTAPANAEPQE